jgi:nucleoside-diphosphate-sugar epimerase
MVMDPPMGKERLMNILITGTDGFIGGNLKEYFERAGFQVYGTVFQRKPGRGEKRIDIRDDRPFEPFRGTEFPVIIHTIGIVDQTAPKRLMRQVNVRGTERVLEFARAVGCGHFIQMSSVSIYGRKTLGEHRTEETPRCRYSPVTVPYMKTKAAAERRIESSGVPYTILRLAAVLGRDDTYLSQAIIPALQSGEFSFCGSGDRLISVICVKNLGPILHRCIDRGPENGIYNCSDYGMRWRDFVGEYAARMKVPVPITKKSILSLPFRMSDKKTVLLLTFSFFGAHYSSERLMSRIEFRPAVHWRDAVGDAVEGYCSSHGGASSSSSCL